MEVTAVVLHNGALAHYDVRVERDGTCTAYLSKYSGSPEQNPPRQVTLRKEGRRWIGDNIGNDFSEDLGYAIEIKAKPLLDARRREGGHPAG